MAIDLVPLTFPNSSPASSDDEQSPTAVNQSSTSRPLPKRPFYPVHQRTLSLPSPTLVSSHHVHKRRFDLAMQPVPEEEASQHEEDESDDSSSTDSDSSSESGIEPSPESGAHPKTADTSESSVEDLSSLQQHELRHPYQNDPNRLAMELEHVKQMHEQDKQFFQREIRNLRMMIFEAESNLQDRTAELEYILKEREDAEKWEEEARREREAAEELREVNRALRAELDARRKEFADVMDLLEETQREILGVPAPLQVEGLGQAERRSSNASSSSCGGVSPPAVPAPVASHGVAVEHAAPAGQATLRPIRPNSPPSLSPSPSSTWGRYAHIPARVASLRKRVTEDEERFRTGYAAWSTENKYLRKLHQTQLKAVNDDLRKSREEVQTLAAENKKLSTRVGTLKDSLSVSRKESVSQQQQQGHRRSKSEVLQVPAAVTPSSSSGLPPAQDRIEVDEVLKLLQKLNMRIADTAATMAKNLAAAWDTLSVCIDDRDHSPETQEGIWLLGGKELASQLTSVPATSSPKGEAALRTVLQISLTTWCSHHVHSWDLRPNFGSSSSSPENPLSAIHRRLKIVEDPAVAARWRTLARSQLRFSSTAWTQALISSIANLFTFLGLTYTQPVASLAQDLQPLLASLRLVREAAGEMVATKELEVVTANPGVVFDPRWMKDVMFSRKSSHRHSASQTSSMSRSSGRRKPEKVVANCGLGLREGEKVLALPQVLRDTSLQELLVSPAP